MKNDILKAVYGSDKTPLKLGELSIPCYVLEDGTRVFSGRGIQKAIGYESQSGQWFRSFCKSDGLSGYLCAGENSILERLENPIKFRRLDAGGSQSGTNGYEVTILIDICSAIIDANRAGVFDNPVIIGNADAIIRAVAKVGIIALVDEATGYDKGRAKDELQKYLQRFIREEAAKLVKRFDDSFFEAIYTMRGWSWNYTHKHPKVVGRYINDLVYERIAPFFLYELRKKNPSANGRRKHKHHQFLTEEIGIPRLMTHLSTLVTLARVADYNWRLFNELVDKAFPKPNQQLQLFYQEIFLDKDDRAVGKNDDDDFDKAIAKIVNFGAKQ